MYVSRIVILLLLAASLVVVSAPTVAACDAEAPDPAGTAWICANRDDASSGDASCETKGHDRDIITVDAWEYGATQTWGHAWIGYHCDNFGGWGYHSDHQRVIVYNPAIGQNWVGYYNYEWIGGGGQCAFFVYASGGEMGSPAMYYEAPCPNGDGVEPWPMPLPDGLPA